MQGKTVDQFQFLSAMENKDYQTIDKLLSNKFNPNFFDKEYKSQMIYAIKKNGAKLVDLILKYDSIKPNHDEFLLMAVKKNRLAIVKSLLDFGCNPAKTDLLGRTCFELAEKKPELLSLLNAVAEQRKLNESINDHVVADNIDHLPAF